MAQQDRRASRIESEYYAHMGFDPEHQREVLRFYVPMFAEPADTSVDGAGDGKHGPVLEIGCGRGEFLGLLRGRAGRVSLPTGRVRGRVERDQPGPPPHFLAAEPVVYPGVGGLVGSAMRKLAASVEPRPGGWAYELAHVVSVLGDRLQEATQALRELRSTYDNLVWGLYQGNETFVVARG